jgi:GNAT superfamily N-acetyltransferase
MLMPEILTDFSDTAVDDAVVESLADYLTAQGKTPGFEWIETPDLTIFISGMEYSMFNCVLRTNLDPANADKRIAETVGLLKSRKVPFVWRIRKMDKPTDLSVLLEKVGLKRSEEPGMAIELAKLKAPQPPPRFMLERVKGKDRIEAYVRLLIPAYGGPLSMVEPFIKMVKHADMGNRFRHYIGHLDGRPVATSSVLLSSGVAGLYNVATLPEARGRGIGAYMSSAPLLEALEDSYCISILQASDMGRPVYERLGFQNRGKLISYSLPSAGG